MSDRVVGAHKSLDLIVTTSRSRAEAFCWQHPFAAISITDPGSPSAALNQPNLVARLPLQFLDLHFEPNDGRAAFNKQMASAVLQFVETKCGEATMLVVHCEAGVSRSTGLANALGHIFNIEVRHENAAFIEPNLFVARVLTMTASGLAVEGGNASSRNRRGKIYGGDVL